MIHRANRLFPVVLVVLMGTMTLWLDQISQLGSLSRRLNPDLPEYVSDQVTATRFDPQGRIVQRLVAERLWKYPDNDNVHFSHAYVRQYKDGALDASVTSATGYYNTVSKQAFFDQQVHLRKLATDKQPETTVDTTAMSMDTVRRYASSPMPTTIHYGTSVAHSTGFNYDYNAGQLNLLSFAKAIYVH
jgi:lipopolysaccharide export system protein LptC